MNRQAVTLLEMAKGTIANDPEFDMCCWGNCIGAHVMRAARLLDLAIPWSTPNIYSVGALLGIDQETAEKLCHAHGWPDELRGTMDWWKEPARAIRRIDLFLNEHKAPQAPVEVEVEELVGA